MIRSITNVRDNNRWPISRAVVNRALNELTAIGSSFAPGLSLESAAPILTMVQSIHASILRIGDDDTDVMNLELAKKDKRNLRHEEGVQKYQEASALGTDFEK